MVVGGMNEQKYNFDIHPPKNERKMTHPNGNFRDRANRIHLGIELNIKE
jgi:hypothetical protein